MSQDSERCTAKCTYCGIEIQCSIKVRHRHDVHEGYDRSYGNIAWSDEARPQPALMLMNIGCGHRFGSYEADAQMLAAATMQDAANRIEYAMSKVKS